jgi:hypothetical protein
LKLGDEPNPLLGVDHVPGVCPVGPAARPKTTGTFPAMGNNSCRQWGSLPVVTRETVRALASGHPCPSDHPGFLTPSKRPVLFRRKCQQKRQQRSTGRVEDSAVKLRKVKLDSTNTNSRCYWRNGALRRWF